MKLLEMSVDSLFTRVIQGFKGLETLNFPLPKNASPVDEHMHAHTHSSYSSNKYTYIIIKPLV